MEASVPICENRFRSMAGVQRVFDPACPQPDAVKKHPCLDCHFCQGCSESRCQACRGGKNRCQGRPARKLSIREQICLYEEINRRVDQQKGNSFQD
jgi:hypothetical protein